MAAIGDNIQKMRPEVRLRIQSGRVIHQINVFLIIIHPPLRWSVVCVFFGIRAYSIDFRYLFIALVICSLFCCIMLQPLNGIMLPKIGCLNSNLDLIRSHNRLRAFSVPARRILSAILATSETSYSCSSFMVHFWITPRTLTILVYVVIH